MTAERAAHGPNEADKPAIDRSVDERHKLQALDDILDTVKRSSRFQYESILEAASSVSDELHDEFQVMLDLGIQTVDELAIALEKLHPEAYKLYLEKFSDQIDQNRKFLHIVRGLGRGTNTIY